MISAADQSVIRRGIIDYQPVLPIVIHPFIIHSTVIQSRGINAAGLGGRDPQILGKAVVGVLGES